MKNATRFELTDEVAGVSAGDAPRMVKLTQSFERPVEADVAGAVHREMADIASQDLAGKRIAVTGSSRGIANLDTVVREVVTALRSAGAEPFVIPGMGSHGGATVPGQVDVLANINNITEATVGCPVEATMDVVQVGTTQTGFPVFQDRLAHEADGVMLVNRVKPHTGFTECVESGLCKMMVIGLGKQAGASRIHQQSLRDGMGRLILDASKIIVEAERPRIVGGLAVVENAFKETAQVRGTRVNSHADLIAFESALLKDAYRLLPRLPFDDIDALIVDEIGKNISGAGMDTNVIGIKQGLDKPRIAAIYVRGLTEETHGNAIGIGCAAVIRRDLVEQIDLNATYMNAFTAKRPTFAQIPMMVDNELQALQFLANFRQGADPQSLRAVWIENTSRLGDMWISEALIDEARALENVEVSGTAQQIGFDDAWNFRSPVH